MLHRVTAEMPPPSGPPQPGPVPPDRAETPVNPSADPTAEQWVPEQPTAAQYADATAESIAPAERGELTQPVPTTSTVPVPLAPAPMMPPVGTPAGGLPPVGAMPPAAPLPYQPTPMPGSNGLAIAALCCGLVGIVPIAAIVAIVLGIVALNQLHQRIQRGKGMATAGIVLGVLWLLGWVALIVAASTGEPARSPSGAVTQQSEIFVDDLKAGDCFSGGRKEEVDLVTVIPCASPHESQVVITFELPDGPYPGEDEVVDAAEKGCVDKADPLVTDEAYDHLDPTFIYPSDSFTWRGDRTVVCVVEAPSGTTIGTALK